MLAVHVRSFLARHRAVHVGLVVALALGAGLIVHAQSQQVARLADAWGTPRTAWVAARPLAPGDPIEARSLSVPDVLLPPGAITAAPTGSIARQHVGPGEILTDNDVVGSMSDTVPVGWRTVAVAADERTLEVSTGDRVDVVADGVVLAADGLVIARQTSTVVVAVPAELAPLVAVAALDGRAVLVGRA